MRPSVFSTELFRCDLEGLAKLATREFSLFLTFCHSLNFSFRTLFEVLVYRQTQILKDLDLA